MLLVLPHVYLHFKVYMLPIHEVSMTLGERKLFFSETLGHFVSNDSGSILIHQKNTKHTHKKTTYVLVTTPPVGRRARKQPTHLLCKPLKVTYTK